MKSRLVYLFVFVLVFVYPGGIVLSHCDTKDGPVVADAITAIGQNNVNYTLKWVQPEHEKEITEAFSLIMKVRTLSPEAKELADNYFYETLVRLHRTGEGMPYTGVKPHGTPIDERILAADRSIELGSMAPLEKLVPKDKIPELQKRFEKVLSLKNFDVNDVKAGRDYVEAYVRYFHFAEGEEESHVH